MRIYPRYNVSILEIYIHIIHYNSKYKEKNNQMISILQKGIFNNLTLNVHFQKEHLWLK